MHQCKITKNSDSAPIGVQEMLRLLLGGMGGRPQASHLQSGSCRGGRGLRPLGQGAGLVTWPFALPLGRDPCGPAPGKPKVWLKPNVLTLFYVPWNQKTSNFPLMLKMRHCCSVLSVYICGSYSCLVDILGFIQSILGFIQRHVADIKNRIIERSDQF